MPSPPPGSATPKKPSQSVLRFRIFIQPKQVLNCLFFPTTIYKNQILLIKSSACTKPGTLQDCNHLANKGTNIYVPPERQQYPT